MLARVADPAPGGCCFKDLTHVRGTVALTYDPFGRVLAAQADILERGDG